MVSIRKGGRHQNALKHWCFQAFVVPLKGLSFVASRGEESEKHHLQPLGPKGVAKGGVKNSNKGGV